ncbi:hypothetical protein IHN32_01655 [Deinococcus sp. 14RED07]|uniref:hypothetical protein n=1 Tax=Deinococcus sp. 14RED07 TaxID=2745874 RepID=UPI001E3F84A5|nr:hypothetical protein [Deinococcus sp. 14RED07]MCD0174659.1 hypothetical protein [Deinococcus sp. 14RED07]
MREVISPQQFTAAGLQIESDAPSALTSHLHGRFSHIQIPGAPHHLTIRYNHGRQIHRGETILLRTSTSANAVSTSTDHQLWIYGEHQDVLLTLGSSSSIEVWSETDAPGEPLSLAFLEVLRTIGIIPLHAAVTSEDHGASAFLGETGSGKTTALISALLSGAQPLTDGLGLYVPGMRLVFGTDPGLQCQTDTLAFLSQHFPLNGPLTVAHGKTLVPWATIGTCWKTQAPLAEACVLRRNDLRAPGDYHLPVSQRVMALWASTGMPLRPRTRDWTLAHLKMLASQIHWCERVLPDGPPTDPG